MGAHTHRARKRAERLEQRAATDPETIAHLADLTQWRAPGVRLASVLQAERTRRRPTPEHPRRRPAPRRQPVVRAEPPQPQPCTTSTPPAGDAGTLAELRHALGADHAEILPAVDIVKERRWSPRYPWYCLPCDTMHAAHTFCQPRGYSRAYPWFCMSCATVHPAGFTCDG